MPTPFADIAFQPLPGVDGVDLHIYDIDTERQIVDALFRFAPDTIVGNHAHVSQTNMLILDGELRMYEADKSVREIRCAGEYFAGKPNDAPHREGGGPDGATVLYSVRGHGDPRIIELVGRDGDTAGALTFADVEQLKNLQSEAP